MTCYSKTTTNKTNRNMILLNYIDEQADAGAEREGAGAWASRHADKHEPLGKSAGHKEAEPINRLSQAESVPYSCNGFFLSVRSLWQGGFLLWFSKLQKYFSSPAALRSASPVREPLMQCFKRRLRVRITAYPFSLHKPWLNYQLCFFWFSSFIPSCST